MIRAAFLRRMAFAALATALFEVRVPGLVSDAPPDLPMIDVEPAPFRGREFEVMRGWVSRTETTATVEIFWWPSGRFSRLATVPRKG